MAHSPKANRPGAAARAGRAGPEADRAASIDARGGRAADPGEVVVTCPDSFGHHVPLPPGLSVGSIRRAIQHIEREMVDLVEMYYEQGAGLGTVIRVLAANALDSYSEYEKSRHLDDAQQRFPDLRRRRGGSPPPPEHCLESKASKRPWAVQSHYDHPGWYIIWRYLVDPTESIEPGKPVIIWRVDVAFLTKDDWKYEPSTATHGRGGRTHTFGLRNAAEKLRTKAVYSRRDIRLAGSKPVPLNHNGGP